MEDLKKKIDLQRLPRHVAIIMDGNGRWAKQKGNLRVFGHRSAIKAVRDTIEGAAELGIGFVTLYAFSTENWKRPKTEVKALMELLVRTIRKELPTLIENNIRLKAIGNLSDLPENTLRELNEAMEITKDNDHMTLTLALSYGGRSDLINALKTIAKKVEKGELNADELSENTIKSHLSTAFMPDPELMIRTSGEFRLSNFLLWEVAYSEIFITPKFWPDFRRVDLQEAILNYQSRERRFGKISEQIQS